MKTQAFGFLAAIAATFLTGCATYIPPGANADLDAIAPPEIQEGFSARPTTSFPVGIAAVRIQAPNYSNHFLDQNGGRFGTGRFSVVTVREVESNEEMDRITKLPGIGAVIALNRMLLPKKLDSERDLRVAASRLQADLLFLYTFDTSFLNTDSARPLTVISLGLSPTRRIRVVSTASALLLDTRTGYIYSAYESTETRVTSSTSWNTRDTADLARRDTESAAFKKLIDEVTQSWPSLLNRYSKKD